MLLKSWMYISSLYYVVFCSISINPAESCCCKVCISKASWKHRDSIGDMYVIITCQSNFAKTSVKPREYIGDASWRHRRCIADVSPMYKCGKTSGMHLEIFNASIDSSRCSPDACSHRRCIGDAFRMFSRFFHDVKLSIGSASGMHRRCQWDQGLRIWTGFSSIILC